MDTDRQRELAEIPNLEKAKSSPLAKKSEEVKIVIKKPEDKKSYKIG